MVCRVTYTQSGRDVAIHLTEQRLQSGVGSAEA
jgi:hypothetical protein